MCALACQSAEQLCTASVFDKRARAVKKPAKNENRLHFSLWFISKNLAFLFNKKHPKSLPKKCAHWLHWLPAHVVIPLIPLFFAFCLIEHSFPFELVSTHLSLKHVCVYGDDQLSADTGARVPATCMKINGDVQCLVIHHHHHRHRGQRL